MDYPGRPVRPGQPTASSRDAAAAAAPGRAARRSGAATRPVAGRGRAAAPAPSRALEPSPPSRCRRLSGGPVEFDRVVPRVGEPAGRGQAVLARPGPGRGDGHVLGRHRRHPPARSPGPGSRPCARTCPSPTSPQLAADGGRPAGPPPLPRPSRRVPRSRSTGSSTSTGLVSLAGRQILAAEILGGRRVSIRIDAATLMFFDPDTRELLRVRPNPLTRDQVRRLRGARPAGPPPRPVDRAGHRPAPGVGHRRHHGRPAEDRPRPRPRRTRPSPSTSPSTTLTIELDGGPRTVTRTTTRPVRNLKANRPWSRKTSHVS